MDPLPTPSTAFSEDSTVDVSFNLPFSFSPSTPTMNDEVDIDDDDVSLLLWQASSSGNVEKVRELLGMQAVRVNGAHGAWVSTPMVAACAHGHLEVVRLLLADHRVDVNLRNLWGEGSLLTAIAHRKLEIVKLLLEDGRMDLAARNLQGDSALLLACEASEDIIRLLLARPEVDINETLGSGDTALTSVVRWQDEDSALVLLQCDSLDPNLPKAGSPDETPLHLAAQTGNLFLVEHLLALRTEIRVSEKDVMAAKRGGFGFVVTLLQAYQQNSWRCRDDLWARFEMWGLWAHFACFAGALGSGHSKSLTAGGFL